MEMSTLPRRAGQNPSTEMSGSRSHPVNMSMRALTTKMKIPKVSTTTGSESRRSTGLMRAFTSPKTAATRSMGQNSVVSWIPPTS